MNVYIYVWLMYIPVACKTRSIAKSVRSYHQKHSQKKNQMTAKSKEKSPTKKADNASASTHSPIFFFACCAWMLCGNIENITKRETHNKHKADHDDETRKLQRHNSNNDKQKKHHNSQCRMAKR